MVNVTQYPVIEIVRRAGGKTLCFKHATLAAIRGENVREFLAGFQNDGEMFEGTACHACAEDARAEERRALHRQIGPLLETAQARGLTISVDTEPSICIGGLKEKLGGHVQDLWIVPRDAPNFQEAVTAAFLQCRRIGTEKEPAILPTYSVRQAEALSYANASFKHKSYCGDECVPECNWGKARRAYMRGDVTP